MVNFPRITHILFGGALALAVPLNPALADAADDARMLASQCAQCHGTNGRGGNGIDGLAGENYYELLDEMREMQQSTGGEHAIMGYQARGYTEDQIMLIAWYFANLPGGDD